ncbi:hypothetical protein [Niallia sp. 03133]|uniref:hypothetical protein n=1 Tax=Niallia sp. 03133 TaxID=3458060 RepID=UPI004044AA3D
MRKSKINVIFILFLVLIFLASCSNSQQKNVNTTNNDKNSNGLIVEDENDLISNSLKDLLVNSIKKANNISEIENVKITEVNNDDSLLSIVTFLITIDKKKYIGIFLAQKIESNKYKYVGIEYAKINTEELSIFHYIGMKPGEIQQKMSITSGYLNNKQIQKVYVNYTDKKTSALILNKDQETFTEIRIGGDPHIESVLGLSSDNDIIYEK